MQKPRCETPLGNCQVYPAELSLPAEVLQPHAEKEHPDCGDKEHVRRRIILGVVDHVPAGQKEKSDGHDGETREQQCILPDRPLLRGSGLWHVQVMRLVRIGGRLIRSRQSGPQGCLLKLVPLAGPVSPHDGQGKGHGPEDEHDKSDSC